MMIGHVIQAMIITMVVRVRVMARAMEEDMEEVTSIPGAMGILIVAGIDHSPG